MECIIRVGKDRCFVQAWIGGEGCARMGGEGEVGMDKLGLREKKGRIYLYYNEIVFIFVTCKPAVK